jgi:hypothetical protein
MHLTAPLSCKSCIRKRGNVIVMLQISAASHLASRGMCGCIVEYIQQGYVAGGVCGTNPIVPMRKRHVSVSSLSDRDRRCMWVHCLGMHLLASDAAKPSLILVA